MNELDIIEQLTIAAEQAGANLAPTYQEYMPLAFAIANSCGEAGRSFFHRLCSLSAKYRQADADKLYNHALQSGRGGNSLGTVFHLAQLAGVRFDKKLAKLAAPPHTHPHVRARKRCGNLRLAALFPGIPVAALPATSGGLRRIARPKGHPAAGSTDRIRSHPQPAVELCLWPQDQISVPANLCHRSARFRQRSADLGAPAG